MRTFFYALFLLCLFAVIPVSAQDGKKNGKVTTYHPNGKKSSSGKMKNYKEEGEWRAWRPDGTLRSVAHYTNGKLNGLRTEYHPNGAKAEEGNYVMGKLDGTGYGWHPDGKLSAEKTYKMGLRHGVHKMWYSNGQLMMQAEFIDDVVQYRRRWYMDGRQESVEYYRNGEKDGTWRYYPEFAKDTFPRRIENWSNGKRHGAELEYSEGKKVKEYYFSNGEKDSLCRRWDLSGNLQEEEYYLNGLKHGPDRSYRTGGRLQKETMYAYGRRHGTQKRYDRLGRLEQTDWYTNGRRDSIYDYHTNGQVVSRKTYVRDRASECTEWDTLGRLKAQGSCNHVGDWTTYYPNGKKESVTPWKDYMLTGTFRKWYANGKPMIEMEFEHSTVRAVKVWDEKGVLLKPGTPAYEKLLADHRPDQMEGLNQDAAIEMAPPPPPVVEEVWAMPETPAQFPGGDEAMKKYFTDNLKYPQLEKDAGKQGRVFISFVVNKDGTLSDIKAVKEVPGAPGLTKEAMRVVAGMPNWEPGKMNGRPVRTTMTLPVNFAIK